MEFEKLPLSQRTPQGFRLATYDEVTSHFSTLRAQHIINGWENLRLLDGVFPNCNEITISDYFRPAMEMLVVRKSSTRVSRNFSLLRKDLYFGVNLSNERTKIALRLSCLLQDIEAIYWLVCERGTQSKLKEYFEQRIENEVKAYFPDFFKIMKILFASVQIEDDELTESLDYVVKDDGVLPDNALAIAEIVLEKCRKTSLLVNLQIQRLAEMTLDGNHAEIKRIGIWTKLLSECGHPLQHKDGIIQPNFGKLLSEATKMGYEGLTDALLGLKDNKYDPGKDGLDESGESLLHYAARQEFGRKIVDMWGEKCENLIKLKNKKELTPLHVAAMYNNRDLVKSVKKILPHAIKDALKVSDIGGRTPLHLAACGADEETVQVFLECGSDPFERDIGGKTAVHHAMTNENTDTSKKIVEALLSYLKCNKKKALLLWISAAGIGTADEVEDVDPQLKKFLEEQKSVTSKDVNVLEEAAMSKDLRLTWEFLNRGGDISSIEKNEAYYFTTKAIEKFSDQTTDQPTLSDTLGRKVLAECISAHFLNPYIKSPITVSIAGGSGSGKSSILYQIEAYLLITAAQLAFPNMWGNEKFNGSKNIDLSKKGEQMSHKIEKGVYSLLKNGNHTDFKAIVSMSTKERPKMSLKYFLKDYLPKHKAVYKSLACMDFNQLMKMKVESVYESQGQSLGAVQRVLTVNFNAGNYRGRTEAWAGLAIEITKEIETSMTWAQLLSTRWRNIWTRNSQDFYLRFLFPGFLLAFVGAWIGWAAWRLLDRAGPSELQNLKYGSVTATVIAIVWYVLQNIVSVFKPISEQMRGYFRLPDYSQQLGYQQKVISDIKFLKEQIGKKPCFVFSFIAGEMCENWWGLWKENVEGTSIPRYGSAPEDKLRIIAFVDDLDQCEETVILPMLWAINLVFRVCEINVILTMDKATIQTAYQKSSLVQDSDFVDKFISKIVQLPVNIPDPTDEEWVDFLETELLREKDNDEQLQHHDEERQELLSNAQSGIDGGNGEVPQEAVGPKDIESGGRPIKWEGWCSTFLIDCLRPRLKGIASCLLRFTSVILYFLYIIVCNVRDETQRNQSDSKDDEQWRSQFSKDCKRIFSERMLQVRDTLMLSYDDEEAKTFHDLKSYATGIQKLPREWKCYMNYHKFARNVVSRVAKVKKISYPVGWEVEFVVWTFVCSQWKHEMNVLIGDWYKIGDDKGSHGQAKLKSSLKEIVAAYIAQRKKTGWHSGKQAGGQVLSIPNSNQSSSGGSVKKERERWKNLHKCLENVHDVSLEGIHCFQHYRYHCDARNLVSKLYKPKKLSPNYPFA